MELYSKVSYAISRQITLDYSTSFSSSTRLFSSEIQPHIYAIYGLVRIADEIVDTYLGEDAVQVLKELEDEVYAAMRRDYSANPAVHAFVETAKKYSIKKDLIQPFFESMAMDEKPKTFTKSRYEKYIYGSAEVIGLMCLRVFLNDNDEEYNRLEDGARALGSAYQKINFLRDLAADYHELGRIYFPGVTFDSFDDEVKNQIIEDIEQDLKRAKKSIVELPSSSRKAVVLSVAYYEALVKKLYKTPASQIKQTRVRINGFGKALLFLRVKLLGAGRV